MRRIHFHPHARQRTPADRYRPHSLNLRELLRHYRRGGIIHGATVVHARGQREDYDRSVGGINFPIRRVARQIRRKIAAGGVNSGLHVPGGAVDIAVQVKLHRDAGGPKSTRRRHLRDAGNSAELALERRRHRGSHDFRARSRQTRSNRDGRKVHLRQRRHRKKCERHRARERKRDQQQSCGHWPVNEWCRYAHDIFMTVRPEFLPPRLLRASCSRGSPGTARRAGQRKYK